MSTLTQQQKDALHAAARARVRLALQQIEQAQGLIGSACATLSGLQYAAPEWRATSKLYDKIRAHWYRVQNGLEYSKKARKVRLDPMAAESFLKAVEKRAAGGAQ